MCVSERERGKDTISIFSLVTSTLANSHQPPKNKIKEQKLEKQRREDSSKKKKKETKSREENDILFVLRKSAGKCRKALLLNLRFLPKRTSGRR